MSRILVLGVIALANSGCLVVEGESGDDDDDGGGGGEMCHVDCFGGATCDGGELELSGYAPRPIDCDDIAPVDYCVSQRQPCALGCLAEDVYVQPTNDPFDLSQFDWLCLSAPPASTATACTTDAQCRPTFAIPASDGTVTQTYLRCGGGGTCVTTTAPVYAGYGGGCTAGDEPTNTFKWIEGASPGEVCLYGQGFQPCVATFLSHTCAGDWDCPAGSRCNDTIPHADGTRTTGVCTRGATMRVSDFGC